MMGLLLVFGVLVLDLGSKYWVSAAMNVYDSITLIPGILNITFVHNTGAAFSLLEGRLMLFQVFTILAVMGLIYFAFSLRKNRFSYLVIMATVGGALGNLYDRVRLGYVRDFIDVKFFAVFNIADIFIVLGMITMAIGLLFFEEKMVRRS